MASAFAHAYAAATLGLAITPGRVLPRVLAVGVFCSVLPDLDVVGFAMDVRYDDLWGHRGLTHSLLFALMLAPIVVALAFRGERWSGLRGRLVLYLFVATASHGVFDAMTDGGLGVAFFSPFDPTRYFFPATPVEVSPIGVASFFTSRSVAVLSSELQWIVIPWTLGVAVLYALVRALSPTGRRGREDKGG